MISKKKLENAFEVNRYKKKKEVPTFPRCAEMAMHSIYTFILKSN